MEGKLASRDLKRDLVDLVDKKLFEKMKEDYGHVYDYIDNHIEDKEEEMVDPILPDDVAKVVREPALSRVGNIYSTGSVGYEPIPRQPNPFQSSLGRLGINNVSFFSRRGGDDQYEIEYNDGGRQTISEDQMLQFYNRFSEG